jgi:chromosome segregation ATPase
LESKSKRDFEEKLENLMHEKDELSTGFGNKFKAMDQEIIILTGKIASLEGRLAESTSEGEKFQKMLETAEKEKSDLRSQLEAMERSKCVLSEDIDRMKQEVGDLKRQLDEQRLNDEGSSIKFKDEKSLLETQIKELERQVQQKDRDMSQRYEEHAKKVQQLEAQYKSLEQRSREREELFSSQVSPVSVPTENDKAKEQELMKQTASLQQIVEGKDKLLLQQAKDYEKLSCDMVARQTELKNLKKELNAANERLKESEIVTGPMYESLKTLTNELQDVTNQRNQLQLSYEAATAELSELLGTNNKVMELEEKLEVAEKSRTVWENDKQALINQIAQLMVKGTSPSKPAKEEIEAKGFKEKEAFEEMNLEVSFL